MVFRYPEDPSLDYIKRVVGVPATASSTATSAHDQRQPVPASR
jgi:hypothetical protein